MSTDPQAHPTLLRTEGPRTSPSWHLPPDLLDEAVQRLRAVALLYILAFLLAGVLPQLFFAAARRQFISDWGRWVPSAISIAAAAGVVLVTSRPGLSGRIKLYTGLGFEVLGSFGIATAQYLGIASPIVYAGLGSWDFGLSWVAIWVMLFGALVPTPPRVAVMTAALSVSAVPLVYAVGVARGVNQPLGPGQFFFSLVLPYVVVLVMVYGGSRMMYGLRAAVSQAREMGSYRLMERLGSGGMGEVWRAEHRMLARPAAIKLIRPEVLGATSREGHHVLRRFEREAQATALLRSAHTVELYDFGRADDGTFYYVMELLDGFDLDELVARFGPVPPERAVHLLRQVCASLAEAHEAGLVHRDIKPANMYACRHGREVDFVKVLDFGLVKHGIPEPGGDQLSAENLVPGGTPAFMSPEQVVGDEHLDGRADLYGVGCVAYWLLTGTLVFSGRTPMETMMMHVHQPPDPPSSRVRSAIPRELELLVLACLAKDAEARPRSADELAHRLAAVRLAREWTPARAREWWDLHRPPANGRYPRPRAWGSTG